MEFWGVFSQETVKLSMGRLQDLWINNLLFFNKVCPFQHFPYGQNGARAVQLFIMQIVCESM